MTERCDICMFRAATVMKNRKVSVYQSKRGDMASSHVPSLVTACMKPSILFEKSGMR